MNEGEIKSRNDGIRIAKGKYITIIDGDDALIHKDILKNSLYIAEKAELDVVEFPAGIFINGKFKELVNNYNNINISYIIYQPELKTKFYYKRDNRYYIQNRVIWSKIIRKELFINALDYLGDGVADDYINYLITDLRKSKGEYAIPKSTKRICLSEKKKNIFDIIRKEKLDIIIYNNYRKRDIKKLNSLNKTKAIIYTPSSFLYWIYSKVFNFNNTPYPAYKQSKYVIY